MLENLWLTGVLVSFSVFGVKVGLGLGSQLYNNTLSIGRKAALLAISLFVYMLLFACIYFIIGQFNLLNYLEQFMGFVRYGMVLHLVIATGLLAWGVKLLANKPCIGTNCSDKAPLLLIMPCPVCATSIFLNLTFARSFSPMTPWATTAIMFGIFTAVILLTVAVIYPFRKKIGADNSFLGISMCLISLYFFITIIIAPIYPKVKSVFAMASSNAAVNGSDNFHIAIFTGAVAILITAGFIKNRYFNQGVLK